MNMFADGVETQRLQSLSKYEILDSPPEPAFDDLTALAADVCGVPISLLTFLDHGREWFKSSVGLPVRELPRDAALCTKTVAQHDLTVVPDTTLDEQLSHNPLVTGEQHIRFYAGYPILSSEGHALGALSVLDRTPHDLSDKQRHRLRMLGHEASMLLQSRREVLEQRHRNEQQSADLRRLHEKLIAETTEHRKAEQHLADRERQLADAQRLAELGIWEWDLKTGVVTWTDELYRIFGLRPREFAATYDAYLRYVHPEDRERANALIRATLDTKGSFQYEKKILRADGHMRILFSTGEVIVDENGEAVRMVGCAQDITARKETEQKLKESVSLLHSTLQSTADGILVVDLEGRLVEHNQRFLELWHLPADVMEVYDDETVLARVLEQLKDPDTFIARVRDLYNHPEQDSFDVVEFKDGRIFERYSRPQKIGNKITGRVWSFRDETKRFRALEAFKRSEERYRSLIIATGQIVWTANNHGEVEHDNQSWRQFTGQTTDQIMGRGWMDAVHPDDRLRLLELWSEVVASGKTYELEFRLRRFDKQWRHVMTRGIPLIQDGAIREWIGFCLDITDRKAAEKAIADERDFSKAMIDSLPGIFYLLDNKGGLIRWNSSSSRITEYSPEETRRMQAIDFVPDEEKPFLKKHIAKVFRTGWTELEMTLLTKSGKRIPYHCTGKLVHVKGRPCLIGMGFDISTRKQAEEEVKQLNQQLEARVQERTQQLHSINAELQAFIYTVSHDLKAPLRAITGFSEAVIEDCSHCLDEENRMHLERVARAAERMTHLIDDLLTFSRLGQTAIHLRPIASEDLIKQVASDFESQLRSIGGKLSIAPGLPVVLGDPSFLSRVFSNVIDNAIIYRKKDVPVEINVTWRREGTRVVISVSDNGIGIAPAHHDRIFDVFQRLHTNEEYPGTGIGLANARRAVQLQGGRMWVESELGQGSTFHVALNPGEFKENTKRAD